MELTQTNFKVEQRVTVDEGKKIWEHFQRFAEYQDLKDLYRKCIPELAKFETKIINCETEINKMHLIMRKFDETLALKASKTVVSKVYEYTDQKFTQLEDYNKFVQKIESEVNETRKQIQHQTQLQEFL